MCTCVLFQIPQRYRFSSKSQHKNLGENRSCSCFRYHKGTDFQANHNINKIIALIFELFQIPQRYRFSSKSQLWRTLKQNKQSCFRYHKGTDFQANHNLSVWVVNVCQVVLDTTKVQIFKQITTYHPLRNDVPQVVLDTTKVQIFKQITTVLAIYVLFSSCFRYHKGTDFQANHNTSCL